MECIKKDPLNSIKQYKFFNLPDELKEIIFLYATFYLSNKYDLYDIRLDDYAQPIMLVCRNWYNIIAGIRTRYELDTTRMTTLSIAVSNINMFDWVITQEPVFTFNNDSICYVAAKQGKMEIVMEAIRRGYLCTPRVLIISPYSGNLELVQYLYNIFKDSCNVNQQLFLNAITKGNLDITKWVFSLLNRDYLIADEVCKAARYGHIDILKWHYDMSFPNYAFIITDCVIKYNHIKIIEWLMQYSVEKGLHCAKGYNGNPGDNGYLSLCIHYNNIDILTMLIDFNVKHNIKPDLDMLIRQLQSNNKVNTPIYDYLIEKKAELNFL